MGQRITQCIYECDVCGETPSNGEYLWHMETETWCEPCCDEDNNESLDNEQ